MKFSVVRLMLLALLVPGLQAGELPGLSGLTWGAIKGATRGVEAAPGPPTAPATSGWVDVVVDTRAGWHLNNKHSIVYRVGGAERRLSISWATADRLLDGLQRIRREGGRISSLEIKGHGAPEVQTMGAGTLLTASNRTVLLMLKNEETVDITPLLKEILAADAKIDLNGCQTGRGEAPLAMELSRALPGRTVVGGSAWAQLSIPFTSKAFGSRRWYRDGELVSDRWYRVD